MKDDMLDNLKVKKGKRPREENLEAKDETREVEDDPEKESEDTRIPEAPEVEDFQKFGVGPVTVPVREATEFMARLEDAKVTGTSLRKSVTDLSHENKFWRDYAMRTHQWAQDLKKRLDEAKKQGKADLEIPPFPDAPFILHQSEDNGKDRDKEKEKERERERDRKNNTGDDDYLKGFAKVIGPYIALGKYLKGDGDESGSGSQKGRLEEIMMIKRVEPDGTVMYIPSYMAPQFMPAPVNTPLLPSGTDEKIVNALADLAKSVAVLNERVRSVEAKPPAGDPISPLSSLRESIGLIGEIRAALMPVTPTSAIEAREAGIEIERIKQQEETKREQFKAQNKMLDVYKDIITEDAQRGKASKEQVGRDFLDKMTEEVKRISAEI